MSASEEHEVADEALARRKRAAADERSREKNDHELRRHGPPSPLVSAVCEGGRQTRGAGLLCSTAIERYLLNALTRYRKRPFALKNTPI